jgi:hypothetical protein
LKYRLLLKISLWAVRHRPQKSILKHKRLPLKPDQSGMPIFQSAEAGAGTNLNSSYALAFQKE